MPKVGQLRASLPEEEVEELTPYWQTTDGETVRLYQGEVSEVLRKMPDKSVQMVVTSPPYWGLRDYGTGVWSGGDPECDHTISSSLSKSINVLSLFDGISCGQIALNRLGIGKYTYFASEVDEKAIKVTMHNYPKTVQLGDVTKIKAQDLPTIDLLIGGSPCQGFSFAGSKLNFEHPESRLFFEYVRLLKECKPTWFLLENVCMAPEHEAVITQHLGVTPVKINSSLVTSQNRERLYWTNIPSVGAPENNHKCLKDVWAGGKDITDQVLKKSKGTLAHKKTFGAVRTLEQKSKCLTAGGQQIANSGATNVLIDGRYYSPDPTTCERLQSVPDNYTDVSGVSSNKRISMLGNGWTVDVITYLLAGIGNPKCSKCSAKLLDQQIGSEKTIQEFVTKMVGVFREVKRVLRDDGTLWLNLGSSYGANGQMVATPWLVALALQSEGWILRQDIIWCLSGGTWLYVRSQKGDMPMMLRDVVRLDPTTVKLWNGEKWTQLKGISQSKRTGDEIELVLRSGEKISCTPSHQFPTSRGLLNASQIVVGDCLTNCRLPEPEQPKDTDAIHIGLDAAWFAGLYLAEGSSVDTGKINIAGHRKELKRWNRVLKIVKAYGGSATMKLHGNQSTIHIYGKLICAVVRELISGNDAKSKALSPTIWRYSDKFIESLMNGYLSGDGNDRGGERYRLGFTRNDSLARDIRTACARLGWRLTLKTSFSTFDSRRFPSYRGEICKTSSGYRTEKNRNEVVEIGKARCREVYDVGVEDAPNTFALASGVLSHNSKPSPMPESVRNRCTKAHEYVFLFAKKSGYFYDSEAIKTDAEPAESVTTVKSGSSGQAIGRGIKPSGNGVPGSVMRTGNKANKRSVWYVSSQGYPGSHFAVFPEALIIPMILAGTSEYGACAGCGAPWKRVVEEKKLKRNRPNDYVKYADTFHEKKQNTPGKSPQSGWDEFREQDRLSRRSDVNSCSNSVAGVEVKTVGWEPTCTCNGKFEKQTVSVDRANAISAPGWAGSSKVAPISEAGELSEEVMKITVKYVSNLPLDEHPITPCIVLDPFLGSGTTAVVSLDHGRRCWGIDLSEEYIAKHAIPRVEGNLLSRPALSYLVPLREKKGKGEGKKVKKK